MGLGRGSERSSLLQACSSIICRDPRAIPSGMALKQGRPGSVTAPAPRPRCRLPAALPELEQDPRQAEPLHPSPRLAGDALHHPETEGGICVCIQGTAGERRATSFPLPYPDQNPNPPREYLQRRQTLALQETRQLVPARETKRASEILRAADLTAFLNHSLYDRLPSPRKPRECGKRENGRDLHATRTLGEVNDRAGGAEPKTLTDEAQSPRRGTRVPRTSSARASSCVAKSRNRMRRKGASRTGACGDRPSVLSLWTSGWWSLP